MLKTDCKTTWNEIEIGEVFAWEGCWCVMFKETNNKIIVLEDDRIEGWSGGVTIDNWGLEYHTYYKLPLSIQRLWSKATGR